MHHRSPRRDRSRPCTSPSSNRRSTRTTRWPSPTECSTPCSGSTASTDSTSACSHTSPRSPCSPFRGAAASTSRRGRSDRRNSFRRPRTLRPVWYTSSRSCSANRTRTSCTSFPDSTSSPSSRRQMCGTDCRPKVCSSPSCTSDRHSTARHRCTRRHPSGKAPTGARRPRYRHPRRRRCRHRHRPARETFRPRRRCNRERAPQKNRERKGWPAAWALRRDGSPIYSSPRSRALRRSWPS